MYKKCRLLKTQQYYLIDIQFKLGDNVIVTEGEFKGVHGRVARIAGQQRVIVELFDGCLVATAYVPREAMKLYNRI